MSKIHIRFSPENIFTFKNERVTIYCIISGQRIYQKAFLIVSILTFSQYFFSIDFARWKSVVLPHIAYIVIY